MPRLYLYRFRYRNEVTGKWVHARYVAERHEIAVRHSIWEITGPPQVRDVDPERRHLSDSPAGTRHPYGWIFELTA